jgi:hypothetical protein
MGRNINKGSVFFFRVPLTPITIFLPCQSKNICRLEPEDGNYGYFHEQVPRYLLIKAVYAVYRHTVSFFHEGKLLMFNSQFFD